MPYKMITRSESEVTRIAGNAGYYADLMSRTLTDMWRKELPKGQKVIDIYQLQLCVRDDLHRLRAKIREIEKLHLERLEGARLGRGVRDIAIPQLRIRLLGIQRLFDGTFGAGSSSTVFGEDTVSIPTEAFSLLRVGHIAHDRLMDSGFELPQAQFDGVKIVPRSLAKSFEPPMFALERALDDLETSVPATNESLQQKMHTLEDLRKQAGRAARFLEALYFLAGQDEIARRVRPSSHRANDDVTVGDPAVPGEPEGAGDDGTQTAQEPGVEASADVTVQQLTVQDAAKAA